MSFEEGVGHAAADENGVDLGEQMVDHLNLVRDLRAAKDGDERLGRSGERLAHVVQLFFHEQAGDRMLHEVSNALSRSVCAVRGSEGIVHVNLAERGELLRKGGIVGLFFGVEAEVFEQQHLAVFELIRELARKVANTVGREGDVHLFADGVVEHDAEAIDDGPQAVLRARLALGTAEVGAENDLGAMTKCELDGRQGFADARVIEDFSAVFGERYVEINADQHMLMLQLIGALGEAANRGNVRGGGHA